MEKELGKLFGLNREAVVAVREKQICFANAAAEELLGTELSGKESQLLPEHLISCPGGSIATVTIRQRRFLVTVSDWEDCRVFFFSEERSTAPSQALLPGLRGSIGNALANLCGAIDLVSAQHKESGDGKMQKHLPILYHSYYELRRLFGNLSTVIDLSCGTLPLTVDSVDLQKLCENLVSSLRCLLERPVELRYTGESQPLFISADAVKIERMLINLIANSYRATPDGGRITLSLKRQGKRAILTVKDNGCGMSADVMKNVFRRYEEALTNLTAAPGAGLGLGLARGIAEVHGGAMVIESRPGEGTQVYVSLPLDHQIPSAFRDTAFAPAPDTMDLLLTELSGVLSSGRYAERFMD